ncbi:MAG: regulatory protein TetR [Marmoricola sp.]|nr:regulatory protein TetR [Marmoricola sp.]
MSRLANLRSTPLTRAEIVRTALLQFDRRTTEPTIRSLALDLKVAPTAIYHHYRSRAALFQGVVELVWDEATLGLLELVPDPFNADPVDVLVATGVSTRRAWLAHHRVARYMAATPEANRFVTQTVGIMATLFETLGLEGEEAAAAFHSYSSFMIGAVLFAADRKAANEQLVDESDGAPPPIVSTTDQSGSALRAAFDVVMNLSVTDPDQDEVLFERGLRRMVAGFAPAPQ